MVTFKVVSHGASSKEVQRTCKDILYSKFKALQLKVKTLVAFSIGIYRHFNYTEFGV